MLNHFYSFWNSPKKLGRLANRRRNVARRTDFQQLEIRQLMVGDLAISAAMTTHDIGDDGPIVQVAESNATQVLAMDAVIGANDVLPSCGCGHAGIDPAIVFSGASPFIEEWTPPTLPEGWTYHDLPDHLKQEYDALKELFDGIQRKAGEYQETTERIAARKANVGLLRTALESAETELRSAEQALGEAQETAAAQQAEDQALQDQIDQLNEALGEAQANETLHSDLIDRFREAYENAPNGAQRDASFENYIHHTRLYNQWRAERMRLAQLIPQVQQQLDEQQAGREERGEVPDVAGAQTPVGAAQAAVDAARLALENAQCELERLKCRAASLQSDWEFAREVYESRRADLIEDIAIAKSTQGYFDSLAEEAARREAEAAEAERNAGYVAELFTNFGRFLEAIADPNIGDDPETAEKIFAALIEQANSFESVQEIDPGDVNASSGPVDEVVSATAKNVPKVTAAALKSTGKALSLGRPVAPAVANTLASSGLVFFYGVFVNWVAGSIQAAGINIIGETRTAFVEASRLQRGQYSYFSVDGTTSTLVLRNPEDGSITILQHNRSSGLKVIGGNDLAAE